jgi:hypothetical protein
MPGGGISQPGMLFIGTIRDQERKYIKKFIGAAREKGITDIVEPCCGSFAMSRIAAEAGYAQDRIDASDVSLFSAVFGRAITGQPLDDLEIEVRGFPDEDFSKPEVVLWAQNILRNATLGSSYYQSQIISDLYERKEFHQGRIRESIGYFRGMIGNIRFRDLDMFDHIREYLDNEEAVILLAPPTYKGGYEKWFYAGDRIVWKEPPYTLFDPENGLTQVMVEMCGQAKCLVICYEENKTGQCAGSPLFCRANSRAGVNAYLTTNDPDKAAWVLGEKNATRKPEIEMHPLKYPIIPESYEMTDESRVEVYEVSNANALYYRRLWTHNFSGSSSGSHNYAVVVDGYLCGVFGYNEMMASLFGEVYEGKMGTWISYSICAPIRRYRILRLNTLVSLCREVFENGQTEIIKARTGAIFTTMISKHPASMIHRGIMKLIKREKAKPMGYKLVYYSDLLDKSPQDVFKEWFKKEKDYWKQKSAAVTEGEGDGSTN